MKSISNNNIVTILLGVLLMACSFSSCKKFIEVNAPVTSTNTANVYTNDATAVAVLTSVYTKMADLNFDLANGSFTGVSLFAGLSADELTLYNLADQRLLPYYSNSTNSLTTSGNFWSNIYPLIFILNSALDGLNSGDGLTLAVKTQLQGEAKFMRAFCYFYLTNLYGDVPLVLGTDYSTNATLSRTSQAQVYKQIVGDLKAAQNLLSSSYLKSDALTAYDIAVAERVRPTKWAATALLARVYLYMGDYANAEAQASAIINNSSMYSLSNLNNTFLKNSTETIWALQPVRVGTQANTGDGALFILPANGPNTSTNPVYLSRNIVNAFEAGDQRLKYWTNRIILQTDTFYYPYKYKTGLINAATAEYIMAVRFGEQYLVRAEAEANGAGNGIGSAIIDLNTIRSRAGLGNYTGPSNKDSLISAILHERETELFTEWGHRWFDLKRIHNIDPVMNAVAVQKGGIWSPYKALYAVPQAEITLDGNLVQNSGY